MMRRFALALVLAIGCVSAVRADWPMYLHDAAHTGVDPSIPTAFQPPLVARWVASVVTPQGNPGRVWANPIGVGDDLYQVVNYGETVNRISADTGEILGVVGPKIRVRAVLC